MTTHYVISNPTTNPNNNKYVERLNILQLNTSNANWDTRQLELLTTLVNNDADISIISEANAEVNKPDKMISRESVFKEYNIEDKLVNNQSRARISVIIKKGIYYNRCEHLESPNNSSIVLKFKESRSKDIYIVGSYREWRHLGGPSATSTLGINFQKERKPDGIIK